eukprot:1160243-Pelagomonas_calceolata.AAC.4
MKSVNALPAVHLIPGMDLLNACTRLECVGCSLWDPRNAPADARPLSRESQQYAAQSLPNFSGPAGAFRAQIFGASLFFVCIWGNHHKHSGGKVPPCACGGEGKKKHNVRLQRGVPGTAEISLWPLATFLHAPDTIGVIFRKYKVNFGQYQNLACTSKLVCSLFTGTLLEASSKL